MKALLVYGTKHGSTKKIAEEISSVLKNEGFEVRMMNAKEEIHNVAQYNLVVVGSAVYLGSWLKEPTEFMRQNQVVLKTRPVWLFTSGLHPEDSRSVNPKVIAEFRSTVKACNHQFFSGSLDPIELGWLHRLLLRLPGIRSRFPVGDFRNWDEIRVWAGGIARSFDTSQFEREDETPSGPSEFGNLRVPVAVVRSSAEHEAGI